VALPSQLRLACFAGVVGQAFADCGNSTSFIEFIPCTDTWDPTFKAILYLFALLWCFLGVAIVADIFMEAIEMITSTTTKEITTDPDTGKAVEVEVTVWNATIANLTLMAFGSSAPEILLAVIETVTTLGAKPGKLGPSTIVGSAAFNLLVISAVCVMAIPLGETKKVELFNVFLITAFFSVFAYFWLLVVLIFSTPDDVYMWEAVVTFIFFPILVFMAFAQDRHWWGLCGGGKPSEGASELEAENTVDVTLAPEEEATGGHIVGIKTEDGTFIDAEAIEQARYKEAVKRALDKDPNATAADIRKEYQELQPKVEGKRHYNLTYRSNAVRSITGQRRLIPDMSIKAADDEEAADNSVCLLGFRRRERTVREGIGQFDVTIQRSGDIKKKVSVDYATEDGPAPSGATAGEDYVTASGTVTFEIGETDKTITIEVKADDNPEDDEIFSVSLSNPRFEETPGGAGEGPDPELKPNYEKLLITILDDNPHGVVAFKESQQETAEDIGFFPVTVVRNEGTEGPLEVILVVDDGSAKQDVHFHKSDVKIRVGEEETPVEVESAEESFYFTVSFKDGEVDDKIVMIPTIATALENNVSFTCTLRQSTEFMKSVEWKDNCIDRSKRQMQCFIGTGTAQARLNTLRGQLLRLDDAMNAASRSDYCQQFKDAIELHPGLDEAGNEIELACSDYIMHLVSLPWKVLFALVPPTQWCGGKLAFCVALIMIGALTACIGEFASLMGCNLGLKDEVTAITFVALGTSLPDTFASAQAARQAPDADGAIGNVTGSNAVNVFFGLGLPWIIACAYYQNISGYYCYPAGALAFSVVVFIVCALMCFAALYAKRVCDGGELGGTTFMSRSGVAIFCVTLWFIYVLLSSMLVYGHFERVMYNLRGQTTFSGPIPLHFLSLNLHKCRSILE